MSEAYNGKDQASAAMAYRYLLLLLLPVIALFIYLDGQTYDPGLLDFKKDAEESSALLKLFPQKSGEMDRLGTVRIFNKDNLFEHINGHAEYFISAGFKGLAVADYGTGDAASPGISVDIYDMGSGANAFGVLMDELSADAEKVNVGFTAFATVRMLTFIKGPYYVKVSSFKAERGMEPVARSIADGMKNVETVIPQLEIFPKEGAVPGSVRFVKEAYRGLDFMKNVFEQDYRIKGIEFSAALMEGDQNQISKIIDLYLNFFREEETAFEKREGYYIIKDRYEGDWVLIPAKGKMFSLYGTTEEGIIKPFLATE